MVSRRVAFPVGSRWKYGKARRYLAVSEFVKGVLIEGGVPEEKISVVYDGVPVLEVSHGTAGPAVWKRTAALLARMGLKMVSHLEQELPDAAILVYVTESEGLGSGALLAMSAAVPVMASHVGGLPEVIRDRENGLLVENDEAAITRAIRQLIDDPRTRPANRRGRASHRHGAIHRGPHGAARTMEVYRQVLALIEAAARAPVRPADRQLSQCVHSPLAAQPQRGQAALSLRALPQDDRLVRQHSAGELSDARRTLPLLRRQDLAALSAGGVR